MNEIFQAAREVEEVLAAMDLPHCVIGGLAVIRWGRPRATDDVDVSVFVELGSEQEVCESILRRMEPRINDAVQFALVNRTLLVATSNEVPVDLGLAAFPFEEEIIDRATPFEFAPGFIAPTAAAEDMIVMKAIAGRGHDWADVESILIRQSGRLDWDLINSTLDSISELLPETDCRERLAELKAQLEQEGHG